MEVCTVMQQILFCGLPVVPRDDEAERLVDFRTITAVHVGSGAV